MSLHSLVFCRTTRKHSAGISLRYAFFAILIFVSTVLSMQVFSINNVNAEFTANASVIVSSANVRSEPGTRSTVIGALVNKDRILVLESVSITGDPNGYNSWYKIRAVIGGTEKEGYIVSGFVQKDPINSDPTFEEQIKNFPESYKNGLRSLHELHPNWKFVAVSVPHDWNTVLNEETKIGRSLISSSADDSWKSTAPGCYNPLTNVYTPYDGQTWVNASRDVVAYYLDPRNFLGETYVFQFLSLAYDPATQSTEAVQKVLAGTFMDKSIIKDPSGTDISYAQTFMKAAELSGSSPYQLVSRVIQEVSASGSRSTSGSEAGYEGLYNFYNIGAASSADPVILGLTFAKFGTNNPAKYQMPADQMTLYSIPWNSPYRSIVGGAVYISGTYISKGQYTPYFQKFDVTDGGNGYFGHQYMTNIQAMTGEASTLYKAYAKSGLLDASLTFCIPIYGQMPEIAVPQPAKTGNANVFLSSLSVSGYSITPSFSPDSDEAYSLIVPYHVSTADITANPVAKTSVVRGAGTVTLTQGENVFPITVTAQSGAVKTYTLTIIRNPAAGEDLFATSLRITQEQTISGMLPGTTIESLAPMFELKNGATMVYCDSAGNPVSDFKRAAITGDRIRIMNKDNVLSYEFVVVIFGDSNGDGKISSSDLTVICRHILSVTPISGAGLYAADANHDGKTTSSDLTVIARHILGQTTISQT